MTEEWRRELGIVYSHGFKVGTSGVEEVARHVLADAECWRQRLGMDPVPAYHRTTEHRPAYDPARSTLEQRLERASLSRAEGLE